MSFTFSFQNSYFFGGVGQRVAHSVSISSPCFQNRFFGSDEVSKPGIRFFSGLVNHWKNIGWSFNYCLIFKLYYFRTLLRTFKVVLQIFLHFVSLFQTPCKQKSQQFCQNWPFYGIFENRFYLPLKPVFRFCKNWAKTGFSVSGKTGLETLNAPSDVIGQ